MTERNTSSERLSERDVDRLLHQFFDDEVPEEFRRHEPSVTLAQPPSEPVVRTTSSDASRSLAGMLGILVSAACCLVVMMLIPGAPDSPDESTPAAPATIGETDRHNESVPEEKSVPIEERSHTKFTTTGNHEDEPESETEKTGPLEPELEIEIFPLRPDKPRE